MNARASRILLALAVVLYSGTVWLEASVGHWWHIVALTAGLVVYVIAAGVLLLLLEGGEG